MAKNSIGDFLLKLGLDVDKNSFETGNKLVDGMVTGFNKLIGTARNASVVLATTAVATGVVESSAYKTATALGMTTEALDLWKASAKIAGVNADGLVSSMSKVGSVLSHIKIDGSGLADFSKRLGEIGMTMEELEENGEFVGTDEAYRRIIAKGQQKIAEGVNRQEIIVKMGDILGGEGQNFFIELLRQNKTIDEFLRGAGRTVFTTVADNETSANFAVEVGTLKTELESISKKLGSEVAGGLTPIVNKINDWIQNNGPTITKALDNIGGLIESIANSALFGDMGKMLSAGIKLVAGDKKGALEDLRETNLSKEATQQQSTQQKIDALRKEKGGMLWWAQLYNIWDESFPEDLRDEILSQDYRFSGITYSKPKNKVDDGILRPDGTVTQVAPDDWVIAARNLGDLARAFIPQNYTAVQSAGEYTINQTFNIQGGSDMPQILRQQAYKGTQEGLLEIMNQSSRRLQLMSGTR